MDIKTQTKRSTQFKENLINLNCFVEKGFEVGVVTSQYWGDFNERKTPLIQLKIDNIKYNIPLNEFKRVITQNLKVWKNWDYTKD